MFRFNFVSCCKPHSEEAFAPATGLNRITAKNMLWGTCESRAQPFFRWHPITLWQTSQTKTDLYKPEKSIHAPKHRYEVLKEVSVTLTKYWNNKYLCAVGSPTEGPNEVPWVQSFSWVLTLRQNRVGRKSLRIAHKEILTPLKYCKSYLPQRNTSGARKRDIESA